MRRLLLLLLAVIGGIRACEEVASCIEGLPLRPNQTIHDNLMEALMTTNSDASLMQICVIFESAIPCLQQKLDRCGERAAMAKLQRLFNFACHTATAQERIILTRSSSCVTRALSAYIPSTCPISATPYAEKMASCRAMCPAYNTLCREKIARSHRSICAVERVRHTCGDAAGSMYTKLQQVMLANDFPIECDVYTPASSNAVESALLRHAAFARINQQARASRYRSSSTKPRWYRTSIVPFTIPTRTTPSPITVSSTRPTRYTSTKRSPPSRPRKATMLWTKLIATAKPPPSWKLGTDAPEIARTTTERETEEDEEEEEITTTQAPPIRRIVKKVIKVRRPKTTTPDSTTEIEPEVPELTSLIPEPILLTPSPAPSTVSSTTTTTTISTTRIPSTTSTTTTTTTTARPTTTSPIPSSTTLATTTSKERMTTKEMLQVSQPWRPFHWLSGARTIPDSILIDKFINWRPETTRKPFVVNFTPVTALPPHKRVIVQKVTPAKIGWKSIESLSTRANISTTTVDSMEGFELTQQYIKNALEKMKKSSEEAGNKTTSFSTTPSPESVASTIDRLYAVVRSVVGSIPQKSADHLKKGFESLSKMLLKSQNQ